MPAPVYETLILSAALIKEPGRPDSIVRGAVECGSVLDIPINSPEGDFWYYGKTMYDVNGTQAVLHSFDVTTGKFKGKIGELVLDKNTTLEDVRRFYSLSTKQANLLTRGRSGEKVNLGLGYTDGVTAVSLNLLFKKERLQEVKFFSPC